MDLAAAPLRITSAAKVPATRHKIRRLVEPLLDTERAADVELMVSEAAGNAWLHGTGPVTVAVSCTATTVRVEVSDQGPGFEVARRVDHGRGLTIIGALADRHDLERAGGTTRLWFELDL